MRLLLTGASSFTGFWFAHALAARDIDIIAIAQNELSAYDEVQAQRLQRIAGLGHLATAAPFGSDTFLARIREAKPLDVCCLHGAATKGHRAPDFDPLDALIANCYRLGEVMDALEAANCHRIMLTGSLFEADEGIGEEPLRAFSPYGLSKTLTSHWVRFEAERRGFSLCKFVIPHPFGPCEKPGLTTYLLQQWQRGLPAEIRQPALLRDFIHVDQLAEAYAIAAVDLMDRQGTTRLGPSGYVESVGEFVARMANEFETRLEKPCRYHCAQVPEPSLEPASRYNTDAVANLVPHWPIHRSWDAYVIANRRGFLV